MFAASSILAGGSVYGVCALWPDHVFRWASSQRLSSSFWIVAFAGSGAAIRRKSEYVTTGCNLCHGCKPRPARHPFLSRRSKTAGTRYVWGSCKIYRPDEARRGAGVFYDHLQCGTETMGCAGCCRDRDTAIERLVHSLQTRCCAGSRILLTTSSQRSNLRTQPIRQIAKPVSDADQGAWVAWI